ncbi:MAG: hypothetical protein IJJ29_07450 [Solobacterium sp.]|nr:hypothetical protein [Solobacterium sp.]
MGFRINTNRHETVNKTIRFPLELTEQIESAISGKQVTFSTFVIQACQYALLNMEETENAETAE